MAYKDEKDIDSEFSKLFVQSLKSKSNTNKLFSNNSSGFFSKIEQKDEDLVNINLINITRIHFQKMKMRTQSNI